MIAANYSAEQFALCHSKEEIKEEIKYLNSLWSIKHPNPFPKNAHYAFCRMETLEGILGGTYEYRN